MKVAYILHRFPVLSETFIMDEIREVKNSGIDVSIFSFEKSSDELIHKEARNLMQSVFYVLNPKSDVKSFVHIVRSNLGFFITSPFKYIYFIFKYAFKIGKKEFLQVFYLGSLVKRENPHHLHAHFACLGATAALIISRFLHIPFSFTVHARDIFVERDFLGAKLKQAKYVIAISKYNKEYLIKHYPNIYPDKIKVIHCGINMQTFKPHPKMPEAYTRIMSSGRFVEKKGFAYLIKACKLLVDKGIKFKCDIVGDGPLKEDLYKRVKELGLGGIINFKGAVDREEMVRLLAQADIFVLPSVITENGDREGIPVMLMEAMSSGKAVVSTYISGIPELITSGEEGILVPQKDETKLAQAIVKLIEDKGLREQLGEKARQKVEDQFNLFKNTALVSKLFEKNGEKN